jgi:two-component system NtrC family sensor kinase
VLVHDANFRLVEVNQALQKRLGRDSAALLGQQCSAVLPRILAWKGCPYCDVELSRVHGEADPCLGDFSRVSTSLHQDALRGCCTVHVIRDITEHRAAKERDCLFFERAQEGTEKKLAQEDMRRRNCELFALNSIAMIANQSLDLEEILRLTLQQVADLFHADTGAVYLFDEKNRSARRRAEWGQLSLSPLEFGVPEEFWERLRRSRLPLLTIQHVPELPQALSEQVHRQKLRSWIGALLWGQNGLEGLLSIGGHTKREFTSADENLMIAIGRQLANTIDKVRLYEETRRAYEDLTRTQEQLLQSEKMSALGQMISGVAHELNNPLTAILGYSQLLEQEALAPQHREYLEKIFKQAERMHRIVQNLLSFARQRHPSKQLLDLRSVLEETLALRDYDLKANEISVHHEIAPGLPQVVGDAHQLEQVFLNIVNNAIDSILEGARVRELRVRAFAHQRWVCIEFHDSGAGIGDPKRIFDPFYTTKPVGKGTGLGLSICYGIVKTHGGEILARNHPQGGALFQVRLPTATTPHDADSQPPETCYPAIVTDDSAIFT